MQKIERGQNNITKETRSRLIAEIIGYFQSERDEEIGIIAAEEVLDFFLEKIAPDIYNRGVSDAQAQFKKQLEGLDFELDLLKKQP